MITLERHGRRIREIIYMYFWLIPQLRQLRNVLHVQQPLYMSESGVMRLSELAIC